MLVHLLLLLLALAVAVPVPLIKVNGTHYDIGRQIGAAVGDRIVGFVTNYDSLRTTLRPFSETKNGAAHVAALMASNRALYPEYFQELYGIYDSIKPRVSFRDLLLLNFEDEINTLIAEHVDHCTDVLVHHPGLIIHGHNEDSDAIVGQYAFVLEATVYPDSGAPYSYTAYTYPAKLSGIAFGFNSYGLSASENAVFPKTCNTSGAADVFIARDILASMSVDDAIRRATGMLTANGISINVASVREKRIVNIELSDEGSSVLEVTPTTSDGANHTGYYVHVNQYRHLNVPQFPDSSSFHRLARISQIVDAAGAPSSTASVQDILGDTEDTQYPIYRDSKPPDSASTLATAVFDITNGVAHFFYGNAKLTPPSLTFSMQ